MSNMHYNTATWY